MSNDEEDDTRADTAEAEVEGALTSFSFPKILPSLHRTGILPEEEVQLEQELEYDCFVGKINGCRYGIMFVSATMVGRFSLYGLMNAPQVRVGGVGVWI